MIQLFKRITKNIFLFALHYSGLLALLNRLLTPKSPVIRILSYHNVSDEKIDLFAGISVKNFRAQIAYLKRHFQIVSLDELVEIIRRNPKSFPKNLVVITFDDGYRNNYQHAYPILLEYGVPATIFLTADYIGTNDMLWTDKLNYMFKDTKADVLELESPPMKFSLGSATEKLIALKATRDVLKSVDNEERDKLLAQIAAKLSVSENGKRREMLSWEEVQEMQKNGIAFGAHTTKHSILTRIPLEQAEQEIIDSKSAIEKHLGCEVSYFAYPNGLEADFNDDIIRIVQEAGFRGAVTNINGFVSQGGNLFQLRRLSGINKPIYFFSANVSGILITN